MKFADYVADRARSSVFFRRAQKNAQARSKLIAELVAARKRSGITQSTVADRMETTQSAVSELESRASDPRVSTLQRYASAFDREIRFKVVPALEVAPPLNGTADVERSQWHMACAPDGRTFDIDPLPLVTNG